MARAARLVTMMIRPPAAMVLLLFAALGSASAGRADGFHPLFTIVPVVVGGWFIHATVLNDLADEAIDRVNLGAARARPLVSGVATRGQLLALGRAAGLVALVMAWAVDWRVGMVVTTGLGLNAAYSRPPIRLSDRGAVASLMLPLGYAAVPYLVGALGVRPGLDREQVLLLVGLYVTFIGRILLKDFRDVRGDAQFGKRTFLVRHGRQATCLASASAGSPAAPSFSSCSRAVDARRRLRGLSGLRGPRAAPPGRAHGVCGRTGHIGAITHIGRGMCITLLAHLTMVQKGWPAGARSVVLLTLVTLFVAMYATTFAKRDRVLAIHPY